MKLLVFAFGALVCSAASTPVILISVDTLRADHLSCYQPGRKPTPNIDSLARGGTLFSQVSSPFPLTLPAHVALFTSTYPFANGVEDNGVPLNAKASTLATVLKSAGYKTGAFVGSFVLDRRFGLSRGFDVYDSPLDLHGRNESGAVERKRPGAQVAAAAMRWVDQNSGGPFFLFLHLYDLHLPYSLPPNPALRRGETGYTAELEYVDRVLGGFFSFLNKRGLLDKSLIVFTSDHGEGLGEHGESTHGFFLYQSTLHVPLIVHWPAWGKRVAQNKIDDPAGLLDVAPTILESIGLPRPGDMRGRSLLASTGGREIFSESVYARNHFGCSSIRSMRVGGYKYIDGPKPELYDLAADPKEAHNLYGRQNPKAAALLARINTLRAGAPAVQAKAPSARDTAALRSLGYLGGPGSAKETGVDPKDRIAEFEQYFQALSLSSSGRLAESDRMLTALRDKLPGVAEIRLHLGSNLKREGRCEAATPELQKAVALAPQDAQAQYELGSCEFQMKRMDEAIQQFNAALAIEPWFTLADEALAEIYAGKQDWGQARGRLRHLLSVDPRSYPANYNLGAMAAMQKNWGEAERYMLAALNADPNSAEAHDTLGGIYLERGDVARAREQFELAIQSNPKSGVAHYHLALALQKQGHTAQAEQELRTAQALR